MMQGRDGRDMSVGMEKCIGCLLIFLNSVEIKLLEQLFIIGFVVLKGGPLRG